MKLPSRIKRAVFVGLGAVSCLVGFTRCEAELTDTTEFALYYYGVTDIAPSMSFTLSGPSYIGPEPSNFEIYNITWNSEPYVTDVFSIDVNTGAISISNSDDLEIGLYSISVACDAGGKRYQFPDIVTINMMNGVPDGITVEPSLIKVELEEVYSGGELPTAQVVTEGDHISISSYVIANVRRDGVAIENNGLFSISSTGLISITEGNQDMECGVYVLDLRIVTAVADATSSEGLFADALIVDVTSPPLSLSYPSSPARVEQNYGHVSAEPEFVGSVEGLVFSAKSITPAGTAITVDSSTGVITLAENNGLDVEAECSVSLTVTNEYGTVDFDDVYQITIVDYIAPIENFEYEDISIIQGCEFTNTPSVMDGDEATYAFGELTDILAGNLTINAYTGEVSASNGHSLPLGNHIVNVIATNSKSEMSASFTLTVEENVYYFTYILWGNDLGLTPAADYANQFRQSAGTSDYTVKMQDTDLSDTALEKGLTVSIEAWTSGPDISVDSDGTLTLNFRSSGYADGYVVSVTAGEGEVGETTVRIPVFTATIYDGVYVEYTPFVFQVNPRTGGKSAVPTLVGVDDASSFAIEYRRNAIYENFNGPDSHISGQVNNGGGTYFIERVWSYYYIDIMGGTTASYGSKNPLSYYQNTSDLSLALGYVDSDGDKSHVINPNRWIYDGYYANGFLAQEMTWVTDGYQSNSHINGGDTMHPIIIWFDTDF